MNRRERSDMAGFTLLEVLIVLMILGMIAAMAWPAMGILSNARRESMTLETMERITRALVGDPDRFDDSGRRIIGGYVGDMGRWPDLWEARAEVRPDWAGHDWDDSSGPASGLGQGPDYDLLPDRVFYRPSGKFVKKRWVWNTPYRKLEDRADNTDHIGGLETENEGQPRGLWTRYVEDSGGDLPGHDKPGAMEGPNWKGPYLRPPDDRTREDSLSWAKDDGEYNALEPMWHTAPPHTSRETWEDGDADPATGELGEYFDEKEKFRLLQTDGRLCDGWGRSLRFFITKDRDRDGHTIFWMISEGPDKEGTYPAKGTCNGHAWSKDEHDVMAENYDPDDRYNRDNIVKKLYSWEWEAVVEEQQAKREESTRKLLFSLVTALTGKSPGGANTGFTGDLCRFPGLFQWEGSSWDDRDGTDAYTKGQPRELWTRHPNKEDAGDDPAMNLWGIGWRYRYVFPPFESGEGERLTDAWGRELLFFKDSGRMLILSRGRDGRFDFGETTGDGEPGNFTEAVDISAYDPLLPPNRDNLYRGIDRTDFYPGIVTINTVVVLNANAGSIRVRCFRSTGSAADQTLRPVVPLTDEDGDGTEDDWSVGTGPGTPAFEFNGATIGKIHTGIRYLAAWNDDNGNNEIDSGETFKSVLLDVTRAAAIFDRIVFNADLFTAQP